MSKNILDVSKDLCTGCGACQNKCPFDAIKLVEDKDGFLYPTIENDKCIDCGACYKICPVISPVKQHEKPESYAVWADDETRMKSSSGGMFTLLAREIFNLGGVVCGARYSEDYMSVYHTWASNMEELAPLRGSKYVQSDVGYAYKEAREYLENGRVVLFTGCPCQIAGLYNYLGKEYENLYTADLVCHGAPSKSVYSKYIREKSGNEPVAKMDFREKATWGWGTAISLYMKNGNEYKSDCYNDPYLKAFSSGLIVRDSCSSCAYTQTSRVGDFTIGDFWGVKQIDEQYSDGKGTSLVFVNSKKAQNLFKLIQKNATLVKRVSLERVVEISSSNNGQILRPVKKNPAKQKFFNEYARDDVSFDVAYARAPKYDIGYVGWWDSKNYGSALTSFAMNRTLKKMGKRVLMLEHGGIRPGTNSYGLEFARRFYECSKITSEKDFARFNKVCETFLVGSDQLWNWWNIRHNHMGFFFLDFVEPGHKRIAYATSFGKDDTDFPDDKRIRVGYNLSRFDAISVREKSGVDVCRNEFGVEATHVLDPVFLCDMDSYNEVMSLSTHNEKEKYLFSYILDPTEDKIKMVKDASERLGLPYRIAIDALRDNDEHSKKITEQLLVSDPNILTNLRIEDWLTYIARAEFVATDSFHGFCFSIIFNKPVIAYINPRRGRARFESIAQTTNLQHRLITSSEQAIERKLVETPIDYNEVNKLLARETERSRKWLTDALERPMRKTSVYELLLWKCIEHDKKIYEASITEMRNEIELLKSRLDALENK